MLATAISLSVAASCGTIALQAQPTHSAQANHAAQAPKALGFTVEMARGEVLQVIAPQARPGAQAARQSYYDSAFPLADPFGYKRLGQLNVRQKVISDYDPCAFIFFSWPDQSAVDRFSAQPAWKGVAASRPEGWEELKI